MHKFKLLFLLLAVLLLAGCLKPVDNFTNDNINQSPTPTPIEEEFCGSSTNGFCNVDSDCVKTGCSSQICSSRFEEDIVTTCEWRECYGAQDYSLICDCVNQKCQWHK